MDEGDMPKVEGCVWVLSTIYNFLTYGNEFLCHACKCLRVCTRCIGALSTHYFRYGEKHGKTTKKKEAHSTFHLHFLLLAIFRKCVRSSISIGLEEGR